MTDVPVERLSRPVVVRMSDRLLDAVKARAAVEDRTMSQQIRYVLRLYLGDDLV